MALINFTVEYDFLATRTQDDDGLDTDLAAAAGTITFTPVLPVGEPVLAASYVPRPAGIILMPRTGHIDVDGRLKNKPGGTPGVRLIANDPALDRDRLAYKVEFNLLSADYAPIPLQPFVFDAPTTDIAVNLLDVTPASDVAFDLTTVTPTAWSAAFLNAGGPDAARSILGLSTPVFVQQADPEITHPQITGKAVWYQLDGDDNLIDVRIRTA